MAPPAVLVVTGASGSGKTTLVDAIQARALAGVRCYHFDSVGVPSVGRMMAEYGSPQAWQIATTRRWIETLAANADAARVAILEGQVRPDVVMEAFASSGIEHRRILLVDCAPETRTARLRGTAHEDERLAPQMNTWAAYLRGQADALRLPVLETTGLTVAEAADRVAEQALALLETGGS
jgi:dephospho-CoA kinase